MARYRLHSLEIHAVGMGAAVVVPAIQTAELPAEANVLRELTSGQISPQFAAVAGIRLAQSIESFAIETLLDTIGTQGLAVKKDGTHPGVRLYLAQYDDCGDLAAGSVHRQLTYEAGLLYPESIAASHQGNASLRCRMQILKPSGVDAVVLSDTAALPTITVAHERYTVGQVKFGNKTISDVANVAINFGNTVAPGGGSSDVYDTWIENKEHSPTIDVTTKQTDIFSASNIPLGGIAVTHANDSVYLRKRTDDGSHFETDGSSEHIQFTIGGIATHGQLARMEATRTGEHSLTFHGARDSSGNNPLVYAKDQTIT